MPRKPVQLPNTKATAQPPQRPITSLSTHHRRSSRVDKEQAPTRSSSGSSSQEAGMFMSSSTATPIKKTKIKRETAESMAARQKEISVSEFFAKNRHLL